MPNNKGFIFFPNQGPKLKDQPTFKVLKVHVMPNVHNSIIEHFLRSLKD